MSRLRKVLPLAAAFAASGLCTALLLGQAYAWTERRIAGLIGGHRA